MQSKHTIHCAITAALFGFQTAPGSAQGLHLPLSIVILYWNNFYFAFCVIPGGMLGSILEGLGNLIAMQATFWSVSLPIWELSFYQPTLFPHKSQINPEGCWVCWRPEK